MMGRKIMALASVIGICVLLLIPAGCSSNHSLANGKYSWRSSGIDQERGKPYTRDLPASVTRDGNKVTIDAGNGQIVGTLEGNRFSGHASENPGDYADLQGTLIGNNRMAGTLTGKSRGKDYQQNWTLEFVSDK